MRQPRLKVNGVKLPVRLSKLVLSAFKRMKPGRPLPPLPKGRIYFQASDDSLHEIPRKHLARARLIDPGLTLFKTKWIVADGRKIQVTTARSPAWLKLRQDEREALRKLRRLAFK